MKVIKSIMILQILLLISCSQKQQQKSFEIESNSPQQTSQEIFDALQKSTNEKDLKQIFINWQNNIQPNREETIVQNTMLTEIYQLFKVWWPVANELFHKEDSCAYTLIQNKLKYGIIDKNNLIKVDPQKIKLDSITNFRPKIKQTDKKALYLTKEYTNAFKRILNSQVLNIKILKKYCPITVSHVDSNYNLSIDPYVSSIIFNENLQKSRIDCTLLNYMGYAFIFIKKGDKWVMKESFETWII